MSINQFSASTFQAIVQQILSLDIEAKDKLRPFDEKIILINITDFKLQYYFVFDDGQVFIYSTLPENKANQIVTDNENKTQSEKNTNTHISVTISGKLSSFLAAAASEHSADALFEGDLHFSGEINTAKQFQQLAASLNIDWEEPLARVLGDPIAHTITTGIQNFASWFIASANSVKQDISEYIQEEARLTPTDSEQQHFFEQVDQLKSKADRLSARIKILEKIKSEKSKV